MKLLNKFLAGGLALGGCLFANAAAAQTLPNCDDTTMFPNPVYLSGSSAFEPTAALMAVKLSAVAAPNNVTLIYSATSSCDGPKNIGGNVTLTGSADYWTVNADPTKAPDKHSCSLDHSATKADVGVSDIFYENCPGNDPTIPAGMVDTQGPVQAMIFIVPESNTNNTNLTAAEAQDVWGCGMKGGVTPFINELDTQQRSSGSGTQGIVAKAINVPPAAFKGVPNATGGALVTSLLAAPDPGAAIGFLAADSYDTKHTTLNALAFQAFMQTKAYYADSMVDNLDKRNVRDGHYVVWGPEHFFAAADGTGKISNTKAANFVGWVNGTTATTAFNYLDIEASANVIPQCAMKVTRTTDGGFLAPYTPAKPCGCYWESKATKVAAPTGCTACTDDTPCAASGKHCSNNFCE
jgi:hypothetical protein